MEIFFYVVLILFWIAVVGLQIEGGVYALKSGFKYVILFLTAAACVFSFACLNAAFSRNKDETIEWLYCHDGDTCTFLVNEKIVKVRLYAVNAPELDTPEGKFIKYILQNKMRKVQSFKLECENYKSYDRSVCRVIDKQTKEDIGKSLLDGGYVDYIPYFDKKKLYF